jgi:two-component sensor histidine kinase
VPEALPPRNWTVPLRWLQVGCIVIPLAIAVGVGHWLWRTEYHEAEELATRNALLAAQYSLRVISSQKQLLRHADGVAWRASPGHGEAQVQAHFAELVAADPHSRGLALVDADGTVVVSDRSIGQGQSFADRPYFTRLRDEPWNVFVDRLVIQPDGEDSLIVAIRRAGPAFTGILVTAIEVRVLADFFATLATEDDASASLLRKDGVLLIRHDPLQPPVELSADMPVMQVVRGAEGPLYETTAVSDGITRLYATMQVADLPLYASFGLPIAAIRADWLARMILVGAGLVAATAIGLLVASELNRRVQARLDAEALEQSRLATAYRETLYRELNHRVRNNLQLVQSMQRLRSRDQGAEIRGILADVALRVAAIGEVHAELSGAGSGPLLDLGELLDLLMRNPALVPPERRVTVRCRTVSLPVPVEQAIGLALIAVEAVTNAIKHAFPDGRPGRVEVILEVADDTATLTIHDDGRGLSEESMASGRSGLMLVEALARQIGGSLELEATGGTRVIVTFPLGAPAEDGPGAAASSSLAGRHASGTAAAA